MASDVGTRQTDDGFVVEGEGAQLEAVPEILNLHATLPTQVGFLERQYIKINPANSLDNARTIEFNINSDGNRLIDPFHTYLFLDVRITKRDGSLIPRKSKPPAGGDEVFDITNKVIPVNGLAHALFKNCRVKLNEQMIASGDDLYAFRGDFECRLKTPPSVRKYELALAGFYDTHRNQDLPATMGDIDAYNSLTATPTDFRYFISIGSNNFQLISKIHSDLFQQKKPLPPRSRLYLAFDRQDDDEFTYITANDTKTFKYKIKIEKAELWCSYIKVDDQLAMEIAGTTQEGHDCKYPITRIDMQYINKPKGRDFSHPNLFREGEALPRRFFMTMVPAERFRGNGKTDPFRYAPHNVQRIGLRIGGVERPYPQIELVPDTTRYKFSEAYFAFLDSLGPSVFDKETSCGIDMHDFISNSFFMAFDLTAARAKLGQNFELPVATSCDLELVMSEDTEDNMVLVIYAEYDSEITVDGNGQVSKKDFGSAE